LCENFRVPVWVIFPALLVNDFLSKRGIMLLCESNLQDHSRRSRCVEEFCGNQGRTIARSKPTIAYPARVETKEEREEEEVDIQSSMKVKNARESFRLVSQQLQDSQCSQVIENMLVCALYQWNGAEIYYDARVTEVKPWITAATVEGGRRLHR
jgi:hypothetical protein